MKESSVLKLSEYRDRGAIGALLDEYEKALLELLACIHPVTQEELTHQVDHETKDKDCISIQSILTHVVHAGYNYVVVIRQYKGEKINYIDRRSFDTVEDYKKELLKMFEYNVALFEDYPNLKLVEKDNAKKIKVRWGQYYDIDQLCEHAIVHILRHRRQIERFLIKLKNR